MIEATQMNGYLLESKQGRALWHLGALLIFKSLGAETNGQFWALEGFADHNMAVPLHVHTNEDEIWYVLDGEIRFIVGTETKVGGGRHICLHSTRRSPYLPSDFGDRPLVWCWHTRRTRPMVFRNRRTCSSAHVATATDRAAQC